MYIKHLTPTVTVTVTAEFTKRHIATKLDGVVKSYGYASQTAQGFTYRGKTYDQVSGILAALTDEILADAHHYETLCYGCRKIAQLTEKDVAVLRRCYGVPEPGIYTADNGSKLELVSVSHSGDNVFFRHVPRPGIKVGNGVKIMGLGRWYCITAPVDEPQTDQYQPGDVIAVNRFVLGVLDDSYLIGTTVADGSNLSRTQELARQRTNRRGPVAANLAGVVGVVSKEYRLWHKETRVTF